MRLTRTMGLGIAAVVWAASLTGATAHAQGQPTISIQDASVTEQNGGAGIINFTVFLSRKATQSISLQIQTSDQTAVSSGDPRDYSPSGLQGFTFSSGDSAKTFSVTFFGDNLDEDNETFRVFLTNPSNATIGDGEAIGTIIDDDAAPQIRIANVSAPEGNGGSQMAFPVTLSNPSGRTVTVAFATESSNSATIAANCGVTTDVQTTSGTLSIPAGQSTGTINIPICGDAAFEGNETFRVRLSNAVNASIQTAVGTGTLLNDDNPNLTIANRTFAEGTPPTPGGLPILASEAQNISTPIERQFTVTLSGPTTHPVTVTWGTQNGTAGGGGVCRHSITGPTGQPLPNQFPVTLSDFISQAGQTFTIPAGGTSATITIQTCRDFRDEPNETFSIVISAATNANITDGTATCTLTNDD